ncbi:serine/threonine-protein phosphatase 6 regulatory ankyrin repeat subunit A-like [Saccostrea echinata]|uniref:serine/threonine-protein phosphatase 6 regulatory ankyrin repeat subunit A-like n=1 Tax=Saccostrea echinata TaxID=191078 RepID=UPI002A7ED530|nr:serine/threonine-protein phosphatase 6 regulatory ankyrin repeat subunit A-like [Saccostrea echinata]
MNSRYRYPVFPVTSCPLNTTDWNSSARRRNCSLDDVRNRYLCVPNQQKSVLLEFCYDEVRPMVQKGNCIELAGSGTLNQYNCNMFKAEACPEKPYFSDLIYTLCSPAKGYSLFYKETRQFEAVKAAVEKNNCVLIIGDSGCGKTATMKHVAFYLGKDDYVTREISTFKDIRLDLGVDSKVVFLLDNVFGLFGFDISFTYDLENYRDIKILLKSKHSKLIMTCRTLVYEKMQKFNFSHVAKIIDFSDISMSLNIPEKTGFLQHLCNRCQVADVDKLACCKSQSFPLLCTLLSDFKELRVHSLEFFENHKKIFLKYLDSLREERPVSYLFLIYCVLQGSCFYPFDDPKNNPEKLTIVSDSCQEYCKEGFSIKDVGKECERLVQERLWFLRHGEDFIFKHNHVFEMLAFHYGKDHPNDLLKGMGCNYIAEKCLINDGLENLYLEEKLCFSVKRESLKERIFADIRNMKYLEVFTNNCWEDKSFCEMFCSSIQDMVLSDFETMFLSPRHINRRDYRIERSAKKAKYYVSLKSNDYEWFREKLLEDRTENVSEDKIFYEGNAKAVSWVIGYGKGGLFEEIDNKAENSKYWIGHKPSRDNVEQIRLLLLAIFSKDFKCFEIILKSINIENINNTCFSCTEIEDEGTECLNMHKKFTPLTASCYMGFSSAIKKLVERGVDVNKKDENESTPLVLACRFGVSSDVEYLIDKAASLNCTSSKSPLIAAVMSTNVETVEFLLQNNVKVNTGNIKKKTALYYAAKQGSLDIVKLLVERRAEVNKTDEDGKSPLYWVAQKGYLDIARYLLDRGAECDQSDKKEKSPLYCAAKRGYLEIVELLVGKKADVNKPTTKNRTALYRASKRGYYEICKFLIDNLANVNKTDRKGYSSLYWASKKGHQTIVRLLLENNAFVNSQTDGGKTALYWAAQKGRLDIAICLKERGADVNLKDKDNKSPLYCASKRGHTKMVEYLISSGAVVNTSTTNSKSALFRASKRNHVQVVQLLLAKGADVNLSNKQSESPLYWAAKRGHFEVVCLLLEAKADVNISCELQQTALYWASQGGYLNIVKSLVSYSAFVNQVADRGKTPLYCAAKRGFFEIVKFLVENGADVNSRNIKNQSALFRASKRNHVNVAKCLIRKKADVNMQDKYGETPLHWAAANGHTDIVKLLCENGSDINVSNKKKWTPIHCAAKNGHMEIYKYLLSKGADPELPDKYGVSALDMVKGVGLNNTDVLEET